MAKPSNPLDKFLTYTYHFELHAHPDWVYLHSQINQVDKNVATDRFSPNGTLLINTRKDAHQVIDDVHFEVISEANSRTDTLNGISMVNMTVIESGGFSFIEKLQQVMLMYNASNLGFLEWALKILFVGRDKNNEIFTIQAKYISMKFNPGIQAGGIFSEKGGQYHLQFTANSVPQMELSNFSLGQNFTYIRRNIALKANTIQLALKLYEQKLNDGYNEIYSKEGYSNTGRKIKYVITYDPDIKGDISSILTETMAPGSYKIFNFDSNIPIASHINEILKSSDEFNIKVGASNALLGAVQQIGIFIPVIQPIIVYKETEIEVRYHIALNRGGGLVYEFDYYFSEAGKNVDIMNYEIKFNNIGAWIPLKSKLCQDESLNQSATMAINRPSSYINNICHPDITRTNNNILVERSDVDVKKNDILVQNYPSIGERTGYPGIPVDSINAYKLMSDSINGFQGGINASQTIEIRGHLDFLNGAILYPDYDPNYVASKPSDLNYASMLLQGNNTWIKVNVWMPDSREPSGKRQFYYTGFYKLLTVTNHFVGGQFKQTLSMIANGA